MTSAEAVAARARPIVPSGAWAGALGAAAVALVVFGPLGALLLSALPRVLAAPELLALAVPSDRWGLLGRSLGLALTVAALSVALGTLLATLLWRWRQGRMGAARWVVLALAAVPAYVHALAWTRAVGAWNAGGGGPDWLQLPQTGLGITAWVQSMALLPLVTALCLIALEAVPDEFIDAARVLRPDVDVLRRVVLPLAGPTLLAAGGIAFVLALLDYSVPALFQVNVFSLAVFAQYSAGNDPVEAFLVALPLVALALLAIFASQRGVRRAGQAPVRRDAARGVPPRYPSWLRLAQAVAGAVLAVQVLVPLIALGRLVGTPRVLFSALSAARPEIVTTLTIATVAAVLCLPLAVVAARGLARGGARGRLWWLLVTAPLAVPAALVGIGLIGVWNRPALPGIYGSLAMPVLAALARFTPMAALAVFAQERRVDPLLMDAARVHQTSWRQGFLRVRLPLLAPGLVAAACVTFVLTLGELGATLIVVPPGRQTLTLKIYNYLHYGASDAVAGLCLAMAALAVAIGALALVVLTAWTRWGEAREAGR